ncbi:MAG: hypothetical protein M0T85_04190 [Dehalococcoidales bacterium]|nr:hypothetical protein [Dehalococcoidales bacterium]
MPLYEYECLDCGVRFERKQSVHEEPVKVCPECGGKTRKVLFPVGVIFKGSGFYITDNRRSDSASVGAASTSDSKSEKTESKADKPESKAENKSEKSEGKAEKKENAQKKETAKVGSGNPAD